VEGGATEREGLSGKARQRADLAEQGPEFQTLRDVTDMHQMNEEPGALQQLADASGGCCARGLVVHA